MYVYLRTLFFTFYIHHKQQTRWCLPVSIHLSNISDFCCETQLNHTHEQGGP